MASADDTAEGRPSSQAASRRLLRGQVRRTPSVITTLAAHAYSGGTDLHRVLREVISEMPVHLRRADGTWTLPNPAQGEENFVDSWTAEPWRASNFFEWLTAAESTFNTIETKSGLDQTIPTQDKARGNGVKRR